MHDQERVLYEMAAKREFPGWGYWIEDFGTCGWKFTPFKKTTVNNQ